MATGAYQLRVRLRGAGCDFVRNGPTWTTRGQHADGSGRLSAGTASGRQTATWADLRSVPTHGVRPRDADDGGMGACRLPGATRHLRPRLGAANGAQHPDDHVDHASPAAPNHLPNHPVEIGFRPIVLAVVNFRWVA